MTLARLRVLGRWLVRASIFAFLMVVAAAVTVLIVLPRATHGTALTVLTASMTPDIPVGSVVIDRPVDPATLHVGDIATYQETAGKAVYITHRIVAIDTATNPVTFTFKGDANRGPDLNPVPATAIRGQVWFHVPYLGAIRDSLRAGGDRATLLGLLIVGLGLYAIFQLITGLRGQRRNPLRHAATTHDLALEFTDDAFGDVGPHFVAELLGATCTGRDEGGVR